MVHIDYSHLLNWSEEGGRVSVKCLRCIASCIATLLAVHCSQVQGQCVAFLLHRNTWTLAVTCCCIASRLKLGEWSWGYLGWVGYRGGRLRGEAWGICEVFAMHCGSIVGLKCRVRKSLCLCCVKDLESHLQCLKDATGGWVGVSGRVEERLENSCNVF